MFAELNRMDFITNKQMYNDALKLFHIEIKPANKGHLVFVTDEQGNPIRYPIRMSVFQERPRFYESKGSAEKIGLDGYKLDKSDNALASKRGTTRMLVNLIRLIPSYSEGR